MSILFPVLLMVLASCQQHGDAPMTEAKFGRVVAEAVDGSTIGVTPVGTRRLARAFTNSDHFRYHWADQLRARRKLRQKLDRLVENKGHRELSSLIEEAQKAFAERSPMPRDEYGKLILDGRVLSAQMSQALNKPTQANGVANLYLDYMLLVELRSATRAAPKTTLNQVLRKDASLIQRAIEAVADFLVGYGNFSADWVLVKTQSYVLPSSPKGRLYTTIKSREPTF